MADLEGLNREQLLERRGLLEKRAELLQQQGGDLRTEARPDEYLTTKERVTTGFKLDPMAAVEEERAKRGLAPGTALEPTGFNFENLKDLPNDVLDVLGPAFPAFGQIAGGILGGLLSTPSVAGIPLGVSAGGVAGAAGGEALRQAVGMWLHGMEQGTVGERAGRIALEGAFGLAGEAAAIGINGALRLTKAGLIRVAAKAADKGPMFVRAFARLTRNMKTGDLIDFAIAETKRAAKTGKQSSVLSRLFSDKTFASKFTDDFLLGADNNLAKQVYRLTRNSESREGLKFVFKQFLGMSDETFDVIVQQGPKIMKNLEPNTVLRIADDIINKFGDKEKGLFTLMGKDLDLARTQLSKVAGGQKITDFVTQQLSTVNATLADELTKVGFLIQEGASTFSINPNFAGLRTGTFQSKTFGQLVSRFFGTESDDVLLRAVQRGDRGALIRLADAASGGIGSRPKLKIFSIQNKLTYKEFTSKLRQIDVQISADEFRGVGKLSYQLKTYMEGLRGVTNGVAQTIGGETGENVIRLNTAFREMAENLVPLRSGRKFKDLAQVEKIINRLSKADVGAEGRTASALNDYIQKRTGINFVENLRNFRAAMEIDYLAKGVDIRIVHAKQRLVDLMLQGFDGTKLNELIETTVDPFLGEHLKIMLNAKRHTAARAISQDALSILKARFLGGALPGAAVGGLVFGREGAIAGGLASLGVGFALQNPRLLRLLIQRAAQGGGRQVATAAARQIPRAGIVGGAQALKGLIAGTNPQR